MTMACTTSGGFLEQAACQLDMRTHGSSVPLRRKKHSCHKASKDGLHGRESQMKKKKKKLISRMYLVERTKEHVTRPEASNIAM